jgi:RNA polymerase sigma factor (sigma-70 family)
MPLNDPRTLSSSSRTPDATQVAFEQYRTELHRFLVRRLHSAHDAQDLAQEAYLRFLQISRRELVRQPQAFLYRLASNLVYEFHVRQRRSHVTFDSETVEELKDRATNIWSDEVSERLSSAEQLERVLRQLPETYQAVLLLRKRDGMSPDEIAEKLGLSKQTVYTYLIRAVAHVKAARWDP